LLTGRRPDSGSTTVRVLFLAGLTVPAFGAESRFADIQRILDRGTLRVAILARAAPPMIMTDEKGAPTGFEVDQALDIGKHMGVPV
jgi:ABC-type amino acid transport substrate-binding protein